MHTRTSPWLHSVITICFQQPDLLPPSQMSDMRARKAPMHHQIAYQMLIDSHGTILGKCCMGNAALSSTILHKKFQAPVARSGHDGTHASECSIAKRCSTVNRKLLVSIVSDPRNCAKKQCQKFGFSLCGDHWDAVGFMSGGPVHDRDPAQIDLRVECLTSPWSMRIPSLFQGATMYYMQQCLLQ